MLYPLKFIPVYKEIVWGGQSLKTVYDRDIPFENTGESWDIACHENGMSIVANGDLKGKTLLEIFNTQKEALLGQKHANMQKFPLLVKIIDAKDRLSLQVHPQDTYAMENENGELGKCEMWCVLSAKEGAKLVVGLKEGVTKEQFKKAIEAGKLEEYINEIEVKAGDVLNIPAGLLHAIEEDILIAEVQQNSDTVYRVYDWNRMGLDGKPRPLHVRQAMDVIDFDNRLNKEITKGLTVHKDGNSINYLVANQYFAVQTISLEECLIEDTKQQYMIIYMCLNGSFSVKWQGQTTNVLAGESILIPACIGDYSIVGKGLILKAFIPDIENDFIKPLIEAGYSYDDIKNNVALN